MKNNSLDDIIKCNIEISSPASNDATFDTILLVVPRPSGEGEVTMNKTTAISKAAELLDYGFAEGDTAYIAATVAFSQSPSPSEILICIRGEDEDIATVLARANDESQFYGIHLTEYKDAEEIEAAAAWAEANEKLFAFEYDDYDNCPVTGTEYYRSFGMYSGNADGYAEDAQPEDNKYAALAWMAKCFGYDPGSETWHLKELKAIVPSKIKDNQKKELEGKHINTFLRYAGSNCTIGGYTLAGEWIDVIRFRDWLKAEMQSRVFKAMKANRKVPFTDNGIGMIEGVMEATLKDGQNIGGIAQSEYDDDGNETPGFVVTVPKASDLTEEERKSRKLTGCHYTARLAGAIHAVEIEGFLTF